MTTPVASSDVSAPRNAAGFAQPQARSNPAITMETPAMQTMQTPAITMELRVAYSWKLSP